MRIIHHGIIVLYYNEEGFVNNYYLVEIPIF